MAFVKNGYLYATEQELPAIAAFSKGWSGFDGHRPGIGGALREIEGYIGDKRELGLYRTGAIVPPANMMMLPGGQVVYQPAVMAEMEELPRNRRFTLPNRILGMDKNIFLVLTGVVAVLIFMELFQRKH